MFFIKRLIIETVDSVSYIKFTSGVNIITGPSNTGKSLVLNCIDYMMGARRHRFDDNFNMKKIQLELDVDGKILSISRKIDSSKFYVEGNAPDIEEGIYCNSTSAKMSINNLWLKLMNIPNDIKIVSTKAGKVQKLTLRSFYHLFLINEECISVENSILRQPKGISQCVSISIIATLLYFATGESDVASKFIEDKNVNNACKEAIIKFVDRSVAYLQKQKASFIYGDIQNTPEELRKNINQIVDEIGAVQGILDKTMSICQQVGDEINRVNQQLLEDEVLIDRNKHLLTQYQSDIKRITFVAEGGLLISNKKSKQKCPFCDSVIASYRDSNLTENIIVETKKIKLQIKDLLSVQENLSKEYMELKLYRKQLLDRRNSLEAKIRGEITPQIDKLKSYLNKYQSALRFAEMNENINRFAAFLREEEKIAVSDNLVRQIPDVEAKFKETFANCLSNEIYDLLNACKYINYIDAKFDFKQYDVVINGRMKKSQGQGFRAFINVIVILAIQNCLYNMNKYNFGIFVADSPFQSLKEKDDAVEEITEEMKVALMKYFLKRKLPLQTIIIENKIPPIDYKNVNLIHFTKDKHMGRYGLINGYCD